MKAKMATQTQLESLRYFSPVEWDNPDLVDFEFAVFLDDVRTTYGAPLVLTSSARTSEENDAVGGSPTSLHLKGRAADIRWRAKTNAQLFSFVAAVLTVAQGRPVELEIDVAPASPHLHVGLFDDPTHPSTLFVHT